MQGEFCSPLHRLSTNFNKLFVPKLLFQPSCLGRLSKKRSKERGESLPEPKMRARVFFTFFAFWFTRSSRVASGPRNGIEKTSSEASRSRSVSPLLRAETSG